jgi:hypothetical protein
MYIEIYYRNAKRRNLDSAKGFISLLNKLISVNQVDRTILYSGYNCNHFFTPCLSSIIDAS